MIEYYHADSAYIPTNSSTRKDSLLKSGIKFASTAIPVISLDYFCSENHVDHVDLIKMDTEGTEIDVLRGAQQLLERDRPMIVCEVLEDVGDPRLIEEMLRPLGYQFYRLEPSGPIRQEHIQTHAKWWNFLFKAT